MSAVDLSEYDGLEAAQEAGLDVEIKSPAGKSLGLTIKVVGPDSQRFRDASAELQSELAEAEDLADMEAMAFRLENRIRQLAKCTLSWSAPVKVDGEELNFNVENSVKLYTRHPFIREQVEMRAGRASFMKRSAKGSAEQSSSGIEKNATESPQ